MVGEWRYKLMRYCLNGTRNQTIDQLDQKGALKIIEKEFQYRGCCSQENRSYNIP